MKIRKLTFQLNAIHLSHFVIVLLIILIANYFLLRNVIYNRIKTDLKTSNLELIKAINQNLLQIEQVTSFIVQQNTEKEIIRCDTDLIQFAKLNPLIDTIELVAYSNDEFKLVNVNKWEVGEHNDSTLYGRYISQIDFEQELQIKLEPNWLKIILDQHSITYPEKLLVFNRDFCSVYSDADPFANGEQKIDFAKIGSIGELPEIISKGVFVDNLSFINNKNIFYAHLLYFPKLKLYISVIYPHKTVSDYLGRYPIYLLFIFVFILLMMINATLRTNIKYTRPYNDIIQYLKTSDYIKLNIKSNKNEPMLIKRSIEMLHNQLDFYVNNLEKTSSERLKINKDLKIAKQLQKNILAKNIPEISQRSDFDISAISEAVFDIGGDLFEYFLLDETHLLFAVGDISGKGIPAALFMIYTQTLLRSLAKPGMEVSQIVEKLNNKLVEENISDLFVTLLMGILNTKTGKLTYCNAAHNLPLIIHHEGTVDELVNTHGIPLGIYGDRNYSFSEIVLNEGDQFMVFTDGVIDSKDENGMNYSVDVLKYNLMGAWFLTTQEVVEKIKNSIDGFRGTIDPVDDLTILILKFNHRITN